MGIHTMLAVRMQMPEMELDEKEAARVEKAIKRVTRHHPIAMSQKHVDYGMLAWVLADVYGTRALSIYMQKSGKAKKPALKTDGTVTPFPSPFGVQG